MRIGLGSDEDTPVVSEIERHLRAAGHEVHRFETGAEWHEVGRLVGAAVARGEADLGVVCCYTGTGVSIAANKVVGVRCALCVDATTASGARRWNDANVLALSLRLTTSEVASEILDAFLGASPDAETTETIANLESVVTGS